MSKERLIDRVLAVAERAHVPFLASALTFDALLAMLPLGLLLVKAIGWLLDRTAYLGMSDPATLMAAILPPHQHLVGDDPFALVEGMFTAVIDYRSRLTWLAIPIFLWFASRLFSAIRTSLSQIFGAKQPQRHHRLLLDILLGYFHGKLRDFGMMGLVLTLALAATVLSTTVTLGQGLLAQGSLGFLSSTMGRVIADIVAVGSSLILFGLLYRYASPRRMSWRSSAMGALLAAIGFDVARRLFGWYLGLWAARGVASIDANVGAAVLFLLWIYWVALVFLLGASVADIHEGGKKRDS